MAPERPKRGQAVEKLRKSLTVLAYVSLALDICIAVVTSVGALKIGDLHAVLIPVNYALTAVVIASAVVFASLLVARVAQGRTKSSNHLFHMLPETIGKCIKTPQTRSNP